MPTQINITPPPDPVITLYEVAAALGHLCATLPEEQTGLAHVLGLLSEETRTAATHFDDSQGAE